MTENEPRIFLCHASDDKSRVRELYHQLKAAGYHPWLDEEDILPGADWELEIRRAIRGSVLFLACLSQRSLNRKGYVHKEIKMALDELDQMPEGKIYFIPVRLEECQVPERLRSRQWVDLFEPDGFERLKRSLDFEISKQKLEVRSRPIRQAVEVLPPNKWPEAAQFVNRAGKSLQPQFGEELLRTKDIQREIERLGTASGDNVRPTDYCYNRINKDPRSCRHPVFKWVELGKFRYLGPYYNYTGPVYWKPIGEAERQVGEWKSGVCYLWEDPRND